MKPSQMFPLRVALSPERSEDHHRPSTEPAPASPDALSNLSHRNPATYGSHLTDYLASHAHHNKSKTQFTLSALVSLAGYLSPLSERRGPFDGLSRQPAIFLTSC